MQKNVILFLAWVLLTLVISIVWFFRLQDALGVGLSILGSLIGFILPVFLDVLLPRFMTGEVKVNNALAKEVFSEGVAQMKQGNIHTDTAPQTPLRSYPLLACYVLVAFFVISSSHGLFGRGFILGLGFSLIADLFLSRRPVEYLKKRWFSVFHANLTDQEFDLFVIGSIVVYAVLVLLALFV